MSTTYTLKQVQKLNMPIEAAWDFFSNPENLVKITPSSLDFKMVNGITEMTDIVEYQLPFGILGRLGLPIVKIELDKIFKFRRKVVEELFNTN